MLNKKNVVKSTEVRQEGNKIIIKNPVISITIPLTAELVMATPELVELIADITMIYMKVGRDEAINIIKEVIPNAEL